MSLWSSLNDRCWPFADALHLGNFFDKHSIPPVILPIAVLLIIAATLFLFITPASAPQEDLSCGDSACGDGEDIISCPEDCAPKPASERNLIVKISGPITGAFEVRIEDAGGNTLDSATGQRSEFSFAGVSAESVIATAINPANGKTISSNMVSVSASTEITLTLPGDFFDAPLNAKGTLKVIVRDAATGAGMTAKVAVVIPNGNSYTQIDSKSINSAGYFTLNSGEWYAVLAEASGYTDYDGRQEMFMLEAGGERTVEIAMQKPVPSALSVPTMLSVCVTGANGTSPVGFAKVTSLLGAKIAESPLSGGCASFELSPSTVYISTDISGCSNGYKQAILSPGENSVSIAVNCDALSYARAKVVSQSGAVLTQNATITLWQADGNKVPGGGVGGALLMGQGNYTEFLKIDPSMRFYFVVANLPGYSAFTSINYSAAPGENSSVTIQMDSPQPSYSFNFDGITYPQAVDTGASFHASFSRVTYGQTDVTSLANISVSVNGTACNMTNNTASCVAPLHPGNYSIAFTAAYNSQSGSAVRNITALSRSGGFPLFSLSARMLMDTVPPMTIEFDITFNGTPIDSLTESSVAIKYLDGGVAAGTATLAGSAGYYTMQANSPYSGRHSADIYLMKIKGSTIYEQNFTYEFDSYPSNPVLQLEKSISPRILLPGGAFNIYARVRSGAAEIPGLENFVVTLSGVSYNLAWDPSGHVYAKLFTAPQAEGSYTISFNVGSQPLGTAKIYVIDTAKEKSGQCQIDSCDNIPEVRKCAYDCKQSSAYTEAAVIACFEAGWISNSMNISHCLSGSANRGDWDNNCLLEANDATVMDEFLRRFVTPGERAEYLGCGDMDNDGDVDAADTACINKVASGAWYGDRSAGYSADGCASGMKGGFCVDISNSIPGDFNGDKDFTSNDVAAMQIILGSSAAGVEKTPEVLRMADLNGDGDITGADLSCIRAFAGNGQIPASCLRCFDYGCTETLGDLTGDGMISEIDIIILNWAKEGRLPCDECLDFNGDGLCDELDQLCIDAILANDVAAQEKLCVTCQEYVEGMGGVYEALICHDGLDNDCNGLLEEDEGRCNCGPGIGCDRVWDVGSIPDARWDDWAFCRRTSWGKPTVSGSEAYASGDWVWIEYSKTSGYELEEDCSEKEHIGRNFYCKDHVEPVVCVPKCDGETQDGAAWIMLEYVEDFQPTWAPYAEEFRCSCKDPLLYKSYNAEGADGVLWSAKEFSNIYEDTTGTSFSGDLTVLAWVKYQGTDTFHDTIAATEGFRFQVTTGNKLLIGYSNCPACGSTWTCGSDKLSQVEGGSIPSGTWKFVGFTRSAKNLTLYVNGESVATGSIAEALTPTPATKIRIGADKITNIGCDTSTSTNHDDYFVGTLDEVMVFNSALSATEIDDIYDCSKGIYEAATGEEIG